MRTFHAAVVAAALSMLTSVAGALPAGASTGTVLFASETLGTVGRGLPPGFFGDAHTFLGGAYTSYDYRELDYPSSMWPFTGPFDPTLGRSVDIGTHTLTEIAATTPGPLVLAGTSQGAVVVQNTAAILNDDPTIPSDTTVIMIANPNLGMLAGFYGQRLPILDYIPEPPSQTRFNTIIVVNEYDAWADPIADGTNVLALANAVMAMIYVHPWAQNTDLSTVPADAITVSTNSQGGTTTTYLVPAPDLPLTRPLRQFGVPEATVEEIDSVLRPVIDSAYARNTAVPPASQSAAPKASSPPEQRRTSAPASRADARTPTARQSATARQRTATTG